MKEKKGPGTRSRQPQDEGASEPQTDDRPLDWEARALARVRPRVRELSDPDAAGAGWETDTITLLEDYFDRDGV